MDCVRPHQNLIKGAALVAFGITLDQCLNRPPLLNQLIKRISSLFRKIRFLNGISPKEVSPHQKMLHSKIESQFCDYDLLSAESNSISFLDKVIQELVVPLYRIPMPEKPFYRNKEGNLELLSNAPKLNSTRRGHGVVHAVRTALWSQVLMQLYEIIGRKGIDYPILLTIIAALHDLGREYEGPDLWEAESAEIIRIFLEKSNVTKDIAIQYIQALQRKDGKHHFFSNDIDRILHDADCLEIMRMYGKSGFDKNKLCFYRIKRGEFIESFIDEVAQFIRLSEEQDFRQFLEVSSVHVYSDFINLLLKNKDRFPIILSLLHINEPNSILSEYKRNGLVVRMLASTREKALNFEMRSKDDRLRSATFIKEGYPITLPLKVGLLFRIRSLEVFHAFKKNAQTIYSCEKLPLKRVFHLKRGLLKFFYPKLKYSGMTEEMYTDYGSIEALDNKITRMSRKRPHQLIERNEVLIKTKIARESAIIGLVVLESSLAGMSADQKAELIAVRDNFLPGREIFVYSPGCLYIKSFI